jgi:hypothetical protein
MPCLLAITDVKFMLKPVEAKVYYSTHLSLNNKGLSREAIWSVPNFGVRLDRSLTTSHESPYLTCTCTLISSKLHTIYMHPATSSQHASLLGGF